MIIGNSKSFHLGAQGTFRKMLHLRWFSSAVSRVSVKSVHTLSGSRKLMLARFAFSSPSLQAEYIYIYIYIAARVVVLGCGFSVLVCGSLRIWIDCTVLVQVYIYIYIYIDMYK